MYKLMWLYIEAKRLINTPRVRVVLSVAISSFACMMAVSFIAAINLNAGAIAVLAIPLVNGIVAMLVVRKYL